MPGGGGGGGFPACWAGRAAGMAGRRRLAGPGGGHGGGGSGGAGCAPAVARCSTSTTKANMAACFIGSYIHERA